MRPVSHNAFQAALCSASNFSFALKKKRIYLTNFANFQFFLPQDVTYDLKLESSLFCCKYHFEYRKECGIVAHTRWFVCRAFYAIFPATH